MNPWQSNLVTEPEVRMTRAFNGSYLCIEYQIKEKRSCTTSLRCRWLRSRTFLCFQDTGDFQDVGAAMKVDVVWPAYSTYEILKRRNLREAATISYGRLSGSQEWLAIGFTAVKEDVVHKQVKLTGQVEESGRERDKAPEPVEDQGTSTSIEYEHGGS